jgi:hypothetical protein
MNWTVAMKQKLWNMKNQLTLVFLSWALVGLWHFETLYSYPQHINPFDHPTRSQEVLQKDNSNPNHQLQVCPNNPRGSGPSDFLQSSHWNGFSFSHPNSIFNPKNASSLLPITNATIQPLLKPLVCSSSSSITPLFYITFFSPYKRDGNGTTELQSPLLKELLGV